MNPADSIERLITLQKTVTPKLESFSAEEFKRIPHPGKWSKQQTLGHLLDSATNNHQRFVRIQYESAPVIYYDQEQWNNLHDYNSWGNHQLIQFWVSYNSFLIELIKRIPRDRLSLMGISRNDDQHTLEWYISDYVEHLERHLKQITDY